MSERLSINDMLGLIGVSLRSGDGSLPFPSHVATDSRMVEPGGAFVALKGERVDGHDYIPQTVQRGAGLVIAQKGRAPWKLLKDMSVPLAELDDTEPDLARLASEYLKFANVREVVAVTGSVGKTTTRAALRTALEGHFRLHSSEKSLNTRIGCTATVLSMPLDSELLLLEFGANKPGEIAELAELFPPTTAIITQVAPVHLEGFGTVEGVLRAKTEILSSRRLRRFFYNADNAPLREAAADFENGAVRAFGVGTSRDADFVIEDARFEIRDGAPSLSFRLSGRDGERADFGAGVWGTHPAVPMAFAAATGCALGISLKDCAKALKKFDSLNGRGRVLPVPGPERRFVIDDAYNANPTSMRASLETFAALDVPGGKACKTAVLGEMREMGPDAARYHGEIAGLLDAFENVILVGGIWREAINGRPGLSFAAGWREALDIVNNLEWRWLLVKGSNSIGLQNVVEALVKP